MFALLDCNNFYASCERLFRPDLQDKPIIVLSSNDGCVIARSNEAKALGIKMGEPFFRIKDLCRQNHVHVFSSNFTLYGDLSHRVMLIIEQAWPHIEIYSIDEAFLDLSSMAPLLRESFCRHLQKKILKETGIPVSIGIGQTKTLAKLANHIAKKILKTPAYDITPMKAWWLQRISVGDIWGIGRQWDKKLKNMEIHTAWQLAQTDPLILKKQCNVVLMRTAMELCGIACKGLTELVPQKSIVSSKSFGQMQTTAAALAQSISSHCANAVKRLRKQKLAAQRLVVFVHTNRFREDLAQHFPMIEFQFMHPTDDIRIITRHARQCLQRIFKDGLFYKKCGICLEDLTLKNPRQHDLFSQQSDEALARTERFMSIIESINKKFGQNTLRLAAEGFSQKNTTRTQLKSPAYTTRWAELPQARL